MAKLRVRLFRFILGETNRDISLVLFGQFWRMAVGLVTSALLARSLGPEGLRIFAVIGVGITLLATISDFGLSPSALRFIAGDAVDSPERAQRFAGTYSLLKLIAGILSLAGALLLAEPIARQFLLPPETGRLFVLLGILSVLARAFGGVVSTTLQALRRFSALVASQWADTVISLLLFGGLFWLRSLQLAPAFTVGIVSVISSGIFGLALMPSPWRNALIPRWKVNLDDLGQLWRFGRWLWVSTILATAFVQIDLLLVNRWGLIEQAGFYALALNLSQKANILVQTTHIVLLPEASAIIRRNQVIHFLRRGFYRSILLGTLIGLSIPLARPFIRVIYGDVFTPAAGVYGLLAMVVILDLLMQPLRLLAFAIDAPKLILFNRLIQLGGLIVGSALLIPRMGISGAAVAKLMSDFLAAVIVGFLLITRIRDRWGNSPDDAAGLRSGE